MSPLAVLVHGYNAGEGEATVDRLIEPFTKWGILCQQFNYSRMNGAISGLLGAKFYNERRAERLNKELSVMGKRIVAVGHSNGCAILYRFMTRYPARISHYLFINPALDKDVTFPAGNRVTVYHTPGEVPVTMAKWIPFTLWGDMGSVGYQGEPNALVENVNTSDTNVHELHRSIGHSDKFNRYHVNYWGNVFAKRILNS